MLVADNPTGLTPIRAGNSDSVRLDQPVIATRSPLDPGHAATNGVVSGVVRAINRAVVAGHDTPKAFDELGAIQTDTRLGPGDSGAPLLAPTKGGTAAPALGFAIPITPALRIAEQLIDAPSATQTSLAVRVRTGEPITALHEPPGARVVAVAPDSPASEAGLTVGDTLVKFDGRTVASGEEFVAATKTLTAHDVATVELADGRSTHIVAAQRPHFVAAQRPLAAGR